MADNKKSKTSNGVKVIKKPLGEKIADVFLGGTIKDAKHYALNNVIAPRVRETVFEAFTGFLDKLINGDNVRTSYTSFNKSTNGVSVFTTNGVTSYNAISSGKAKPQISGYSSRNPETLVFYDTKDDDGRILRGIDRAAYVLAELQKQIMTATYATVSDYYDIAQVTAGHFTDANFGWRDLSMARIAPRDGGYIIILPPAEQVK